MEQKTIYSIKKIVTELIPLSIVYFLQIALIIKIRTKGNLTFLRLYLLLGIAFLYLGSRRLEYSLYVEFFETMSELN